MTFLYLQVCTLRAWRPDRLIEAAQELLWERGYTAMSPKDIQALAQAGQGSMYHHFKGKQDLAALALQRSAEQMRRDAQEPAER